MENRFIKKIKQLDKDTGINTRKLITMDKEIWVCYIKELTDRDKLSENIIKPLVRYNNPMPLTIENIASSIIYIDEISIDYDDDKLIDYILEGNTVILLGDTNYIAANTLKTEKRQIQTPEIQGALRGPKESFIESLETNLSMIRYRIQDPSLSVDVSIIGKRSKTKVALVYMKDIANPKYIKELKQRLKKIHTDGIFESGYIQKYIANKTFGLFPQAGIVERPDMACSNILDGKICILVNGTNLGLIVPKTFVEFLDSDDDNYDNVYVSMFIKVIRFSSIFVSLTLSSIYVALVSFHPDILPPQYILTLANFRKTVPFNALTEAIIMELAAEILKESSLRLPKQIGPTIGIVGSIVIGQAASIAGLVSPLMIIIVALSTMSSFIAPDYTIMNPIRILKYVLIIMTGIYGLYGLIMGLTLIIINMASTSSLGVPYLTPAAPFYFKDLKNYFISQISVKKTRPDYLNPQDKKRQK